MSNQGTIRHPVSSHPPIMRAGFTLMEMVISLALSTILLLSLTSVVLLSARSLSLHDAEAARTIKSFALSSQVTSDLKLAERFLETTPNAVSFTVPDRDNDSRSEIIRYAWDPVQSRVTRSVQMSSSNLVAAEEMIAEQINHFNFEYVERTSGDPLNEAIENFESRLVYANADRPDYSDNQLLFVVQDRNALTPAETMRKSLFESWGFSVWTLSDGSDDFWFDLLLQYSDVVVVSPDINASVLHNRLNDLGIGIVNENIDLMQRLEIGLPTATAAPQTIALANRMPHYITSELTPGAFPIFRTPVLTGSVELSREHQAPGLINLVEWPDEPALAVLESGAESFQAVRESGALGFTTAFPNPSVETDFNKKQVATRVTLGQTSDVSSIAAYLQIHGATSVKFAVYSDQNGEPERLLAETDETDVVADPLPRWLSIELKEHVRLEPGDYWLAIGMKDKLTFFYDDTFGLMRAADPGGNPAKQLSLQWAGNYLSTVGSISIYANYSEVPYSSGRRVQLPCLLGEWTPSQVTPEAVELMRRSLWWAADRSPLPPAKPFYVDQQDHWVECFAPDRLPLNATGWTIDRLQILVKRNPVNPSGAVRFSLHVDNGAIPPTGRRLGQTRFLATASLRSDEWEWYQIPFDRLGWLQPDESVCLKIEGQSKDTDLVVGFDPAPTGALSLTTGPTITDHSRIYVYGKYRTGGDPQW